MKHILPLTLVGLALLGTPPARGGTTYQDGDVLLIFRQTGLNDVEYDLGNISQFTNHPNGYAAAVTGWDPTVATGVFGSDLTGVSVIVASTTSLTNANRTSWLSSGNPSALISDVTAHRLAGQLVEHHQRHRQPAEDLSSGGDISLLAQSGWKRVLRLRGFRRRTE